MGNVCNLRIVLLTLRRFLLIYDLGVFAQECAITIRDLSGLTLEERALRIQIRIPICRKKTILCSS